MFQTQITLGSMVLQVLHEDGCFQTLKTSSGCSWTWRKLLNLRSLARPFVKDIIGDGQRTFPCHDNCTPTLRVLISVIESWRLQDSYKCQKIPPLFAMINGCWHVAISFFTPSKFPTPLSQVRSGPTVYLFLPYSQSCQAKKNKILIWKPTAIPRLFHSLDGYK